MSARGARSRKVQQKDIEKKEKKSTDKEKAPEAIHEIHDAFAEWRPTPSINNLRNGISRSITVSSSNSRATSRSSSTQDGSGRQRQNTFSSNDPSEVRPVYPPNPSGGRSASVSDASLKSKEKTKFQAKGKETKAPRGRGGGVPVKKNVAPSHAPSVSPESAASYPLANRKTWINFKVWEGVKDVMRPYGGFDFDEDMQSGSVLIYFKGDQVDEDCSIPTIRAELEVLENSGSTWLSQVLHCGKIGGNDVDEWGLSNSSESLMSSRYFSPNYHQAGQRTMLSPTSPGGRSPPPFDIDQTYAGIDARSASRAYHFSEVNHQDRSSTPLSPQETGKKVPTHEIYFIAPTRIKTPQKQRLYHVAVRNFLAMLHSKPIVGADLFDMLSTLQPQIQDMYDLDSNDQSRVTARERSVQMITNYLGQHGLDDLRNNVKQALGILAWSEQDTVKWRQGYLESFIHLAGIMTPEMEDFVDFQRLSIATRRNLGLAGKTLQLRVMEAEEKLAGFDFSEFWEDASKAANSPVYQSYQSFRQFLISHHTRIYSNWPPTSSKTWLNRNVVHAMQEDFGSLYDYIVNRDVIWNPREERASRKWEMSNRKIDDFEADLPELGMTNMLVAFDTKYGYAHIPHPYPLLPREVPKAGKEKEKKSFFSSLKKDKNKDATKDAKAHLQLSIVFSDATNIEKLDVNFNGSTLIDRFEQFELTTDLKHTTPREARLGRWVLLYGILQVLSTLSVDVQGLKHTDGVRYFLCADLQRMPKWVTNGQLEYLEASQRRSWCWQRTWDPMPTQTAPVELEASSAVSRNDGAHYHQEEPHDAEIDGYSFPNPPSERQMPTSPPSFDGATTLMQNDMRHLGEKTDHVFSSHNRTHTFHPQFERRRENEKGIKDDFHDQSPPPTNNNNTFRPPYRTDSLPRHTNDLPRNPSRMDDTYRLTESDFRGSSPSPLGPVRSHADTEIGAYPFSPNDMQQMQWPVPPGYTEAGYREGTVLGNQYGYVDLTSRGIENHTSPRRLHERSGWN